MIPDQGIHPQTPWQPIAFIPAPADLPDEIDPQDSYGCIMMYPHKKLRKIPSILNTITSIFSTSDVAGVELKGMKAKQRN